MLFQNLKNFLQNRMRMSHIYQPAMIKLLLRNNGNASINEIAFELLSHDPSQIEYYETITSNMAGRVLSKHNILDKKGRQFRLLDYEQLRIHSKFYKV